MPKGLHLPLVLGIYTLRAGLKLYFSLLNLREVSSNHLIGRPSRVSLSTPLTMFPGLDLMVS